MGKTRKRGRLEEEGEEIEAGVRGSRRKVCSNLCFVPLCTEMSMKVNCA